MQMAHSEYLKWYNTLTRKQKFRHHVSQRGHRFDDWLCDQSWAKDWMFYYEGWAIGFCWILGHNPINDHCGKPEHDYCASCGHGTPGKAGKQ